MSQAEKLGPGSSRRRRRPRSSVQERRGSAEGESGANGGAIDLARLEQRVRQELQRLLGREVRGGARAGASKADLEFLETRLRQVLQHLLTGGAGSGLDPDRLPSALDIDIIERRMRSILRSRLARSMGERGPGTRLDGFDMVILGQRVREEVARALDSETPGSDDEQIRLQAFDRDLIEIRVKQELAHRIPRLRELGWGGKASQAATSPLVPSLASSRMRNAIRRALKEYRDLTGPRLSDDDIDDLIDRVVSQG